MGVGLQRSNSLNPQQPIGQPMATLKSTNGDYSDYPDIAKDPNYVHFILTMKAQDISNSF